MHVVLKRFVSSTLKNYLPPLIWRPDAALITASASGTATGSTPLLLPLHSPTGRPRTCSAEGRAKRNLLVSWLTICRGQRCATTSPTRSTCCGGSKQGLLGPWLAEVGSGACYQPVCPAAAVHTWCSGPPRWWQVSSWRRTVWRWGWWCCRSRLGWAASSNRVRQPSISLDGRCPIPANSGFFFPSCVFVCVIHNRRSESVIPVGSGPLELPKSTR